MYNELIRQIDDVLINYLDGRIIAKDAMEQLHRLSDALIEDILCNS